MKKIIIFLVALLLLTGCLSQKQTDSFSETLLDEKLLVQTFAEEVDNRKEELIEDVGEKLEEIGVTIAEDLQEKVSEVSKELVTHINKEIVIPALARQERILTHSIELAMSRQEDILREYSNKLDEKHAEILGRLPLYGLFIVVLVWGASVIDDFFRYLVGKKAKQRRVEK